MGWVLAQDRGLLLAQARDAARLAAIDAPNIDAFGLVINLRRYTPTRGGRPDHPAPGRRRAEGGGRRGRGRPARHRRLPRGPQRPAAPGRPGRAAVDAGRHLRRQRDHRPDLRRGRRRRGAPRRVPRPRCASATARAAATGSSTTSPSSRTPIRPRRSARPSRTGARTSTARATRSSTPAPSSPTGPRGLGRAASAHPRWSSNFLLVGASRSATGHPLFVGGPQIGYMYPRPDARGRHQLPRRAGARRDLARLRRQHPDRPRAGLRVDADLGEQRPDRHLRRALCGGSRTKYRYKGRCRTMGTRRRGHDRRLRPRPLPHDRARPGGGLREGRRQDRRGQPQARQLRPGRPLAARLPRPDHGQGRLGGRRCARRCRPRRSRSTSATPTTATSRCTRPAGCPCATAGSTRGCPPGAPASTSGKASCAPRSTRTRSTRPAGCS